MLAVCAAVVLLLNYKGVRRQLPVDYHLPAHDNQSLSLWRAVRPFLNPLVLIKDMAIFAPDKIGEGVEDPEELMQIEERFKV